MCAEENLLALPSDRHKDHRDIATHEFAHVIHRHGVDAAYGKRITAAYARAKADGLWRTAYAMTNEQEFFAELSMWYFHSRGDYGKIDPRPVEGPAWLRAYLHAASRLSIVSMDAATVRWLISLRVVFPFSFTAHAASHAAAPPVGSAHSAAHVSSSVRPQFAAMPGRCAAPTTATV